MILFASPGEVPNPVDYVNMVANGGMAAILLYIVTRGLPMLIKAAREMLEMIRSDHRQAMEEFQTIAKEQREHDATEGKFERLQCEKNIATMSSSLTSSNLAVATALDGQAKAVEGLKQAVHGMVAVSQKAIDKSSNA